MRIRQSIGCRGYTDSYCRVQHASRTREIRKRTSAPATIQAVTFIRGREPRGGPQTASVGSKAYSGSLFVPRCCVDNIESGIESPACGAHELIQGDVSVGEIAYAKRSNGKSYAAERASGAEAV